MKSTTSHYGYAAREDAGSKRYLGEHRPVYWPDACPQCGAAMQFEFAAPEAEDPRAFRRCPAGHTVTAAQCRVKVISAPLNTQPSTLNCFA